MTTDKPEKFGWYCLTARLPSEDGGPDFQFVHFVQATSRRSAARHFGGLYTVVDGSGGLRTIQFPKRPHEVLCMPRNWAPESIVVGAIPGLRVVVYVTPAHRYECPRCGEVRLSEHPYPFVWCRCGHRIHLVADTEGVTTDALDERKIDDSLQSQPKS